MAALRKINSVVEELFTLSSNRICYGGTITTYTHLVGYKKNGNTPISCRLTFMQPLCVDETTVIPATDITIVGYADLKQLANALNYFLSQLEAEDDETEDISANAKK